MTYEELNQNGSSKNRSDGLRKYSTVHLKTKTVNLSHLTSSYEDETSSTEMEGCASNVFVHSAT